MSSRSVWEICKSRRSVTTVLIVGSTIVIASEIACFLYNKLLGRSFNKQNLKKCLLPMTPEQIEQEKINLRKPKDKWNTVLFFPDTNQDDPNSPTTQLLYYFDSARISIHICMYLCSQPFVWKIIKKKHHEGCLIQVVTDWDTYTAHNSWGIKHWKRTGIEVRMKATGYLMHHKFAIIDEESLLTGSLNWTKQGFIWNQENVLVTTNKRIVRKYMEEFQTLWSMFNEES